MPDQAPAISVVMTIHNSAFSVRDAVLSITGQTFPDIEIIIVDDASTDETPEILRELASTDLRIRILTMQQNVGAFASANAGLAEARAPLIARMDSDDISLAHRLEVQKAYMDANPRCILISSGFNEIDQAGKTLRTIFRPRDAFQTEWIGRFHYPLRHPATMFRRLSLEGEPLRYSEETRVAMDYEFYARNRVLGDVVSLAEPLLSYRVHDGSITGTRRTQQLSVASRISLGIQSGLPCHLQTALKPFNKAFLFSEPVKPKVLFEAMRALVQHDCQRHPSRQAWMMRQSCTLILMAMSRIGLSRRSRLLAFATHGSDFLPSLAGKTLESRGIRVGAGAMSEMHTA